MARKLSVYPDTVRRQFFNNLIKSLLRITGTVAGVLVLAWLGLARPLLPGNSEYRSETVVDSDALREHVEILSRRWMPRSYEYPENLDRVAEYIGACFAARGARVSEQVFEVNGRKYRNVIAEYGPPTPEVTVIGAHYDTAGEQPGADDNGSGVAGLLELGGLLSGDGLKTRVMLAAYTLEEPPFFRTGFMGSAVHARSLKERQVPVKLMISLEMIGYFTDEQGSQRFPIPLMRFFYPSTGNFIAIVDRVFSPHARRVKRSMRRAAEVAVHSINAPAFVPGIDFSDHYNFWRQGYPAVMVTDTAFYRNEAYHSIEDTADRLNYDNMAQVVLGVYAHVKNLAGAE